MNDTKKGFFGRMFDKIDKAMKEKADRMASSGCSCSCDCDTEDKKSKDKGNNSCCSK